MRVFAGWCLNARSDPFGLNGGSLVRPDPKERIEKFCTNIEKGEVRNAKCEGSGVTNNLLFALLTSHFPPAHVPFFPSSTIPSFCRNCSRHSSPSSDAVLPV